MKRRLLDWLACPARRGPIALARAVPDADESARASSARAPVARPTIADRPAPAPPAVSVEALDTAERFGYEWTRFAEIRPEYEAQRAG